MSTQVTEPYLPSITSLSSENQLLNARYIVEPDFDFINSLLNDLSIVPPLIQQKRLDTLYSLMNINDMLREEISHDYLRTVRYLYSHISLNETLIKNDLITNIKFFKLINLCVNKCPYLLYPHLIQFKEYLFYLIDSFKLFMNENDISINSNDRMSCNIIICDLLFTFLLHISNTDWKFDCTFNTYLEDLIFQIINKYIHGMNFKYSLKVRLSKNESYNSYNSLLISSKDNETINYQISQQQSENTSYSVAYDCLSNKGLLLSNLIPNPVKISSVIECTILSRCLVLYTEINSSISIINSSSNNNNIDINSKIINPSTLQLWQNPHVMLFVSSLLKYPNIELKLSALKFLLFPFLHVKHSSLNKNNTNNLRNITKYLPYLFQSLDYGYIPFWFDPFDYIIDLIVLFNEKNPTNNPILVYIDESNLYKTFLDVFTSCIELSSKNQYILETLIKMVHIWASLSSFEERTRCAVVNIPNILTRLKGDVESHINLLNEFIEYYQSVNKNKLHTKRKFPPLHDSKLVLAWLHLLKSFSRSITILRTKLQKVYLTETLAKMLNVLYRLTHMTYDVGNSFLKIELEIMELTLGNICNFIVEFSSLQVSVLQTDIIGTIKEILTDSLFNPNSETNFNKERADAFKDLKLQDIKAYSLWVLRHLMYNCPNSEKMKLLQRIPLDIILDFINDPNWSVQEQCCQLLRNLTCNSRRVVNVLLEKFKYVEFKIDSKTGLNKKVGSTYLFEYLARKMRLLDMRDKCQRKTLEAILYIINNIAAVNEDKKRLVVEQNDILEILKAILSESSQNSLKYGNDSDLKLASLWVLNNLLWNSSLSTYTQYVLEGYTATAENNINKSTSSVNANNNTSSINDTQDSSSSSRSSNEVNTYGSNNESKPYNLLTGEDRHTIAGEEEEETENDDNDKASDEFIHPFRSATDDINTKSVHAGDYTVERCKKLEAIGLYALIKQNIFDDSLDVREKARTLLYHMDLLLKKV